MSNDMPAHADSGMPEGVGDWLTLADAAQRLDVSVKTVRRRVRAGELAGEMIHDPAIGAARWRIDPASLPQQPRADMVPLEIIQKLEEAWTAAREAAAAQATAESVSEFERERRQAVEAERDNVKDSHDEYREKSEAERDELQARIAELEARRWWQRRPPVPTHDDPSTDRLHRL